MLRIVEFEVAFAREVCVNPANFEALVETGLAIISTQNYTPEGEAQLLRTLVKSGQLTSEIVLILLQ